MSATDTSTDESTDRPSLDRAQYARRDWWGDDDSRTESTGHTETQGTTKEESVSHLWLKQTTDYLLDPIALAEPPENGMHERDGVQVELTDPEVYPPTGEGSQLERRRMERKAPSSKRWRYSREYGHLTYGGIIPDRPMDELLELIDFVTENINNVDVPPRNRREIRQRAADLKRDDSMHDTQIMRKVAYWIFNPNELRDEN